MAKENLKLALGLIGGFVLVFLSFSEQDGGAAVFSFALGMGVLLWAFYQRPW